MAKKITAREVAELAGVSRTTVSMILNQTPDIRFSQETRDRVLAACRELGYEPPSKARQGVQRQKLLLAVCPSYENFHYGRLVERLQAKALELGYHLIAYSTFRDSAVEGNLQTFCREVPVSGVLFLYNPENSSIISRLSQELPVLLVYDKSVSSDIDVVELDNFKVGRIIAEHLLQLGHRHVAAVFPSLSEKHLGRLRRVEGMQEVFRRQGLDPGRYLQILVPQPGDVAQWQTASGYDVGFALATRVIEEDSRVTAFVGNNDMAAFGIMDAILTQGKRIPKDYSVIGCDNLTVSGFKRVGLTSVDPFSAQRAQEAVRVIVQKIERKGQKSFLPVETVRVAYEPKLIRRETTDKAPQREEKE